MIARSDRIAAVTALASFVVEIDLSDRFQAARLSASGRSATVSDQAAGGQGRRSQTGQKRLYG